MGGDMGTGIGMKSEEDSMGEDSEAGGGMGGEGKGGKGKDGGRKREPRKQRMDGGDAEEEVEDEDLIAEGPVQSAIGASSIASAAVDEEMIAEGPL